MASSPGVSVQPAPTGPWFRQRPQLAIVVAGALSAGIFALRIADSSTANAVGVLYVLPVALLALTFGFRVGVAASAGAVGLLVAGTRIAGVSLTPLGWLTRITPVLLLGVLVGFASDQLREAFVRERHYAEVALLHREAAEINDGIVQGLAAAKWLLESGRTDAALDAVNETIDTTQRLVSRMLRNDTDEPGDRLRTRQVRGGDPDPGTHAR